MNPEASAGAKRTSIAGLVTRLARRLGDPEFPTGDHAALRRLSTDRPELRHAVALYRLMEDVGISASDTDQIRSWATIINALALCQGAHDPDRFCGAALHAASFSEERLAALLAADRDTLIDLLPRVARRLSATGERMDWSSLQDCSSTSDGTTRGPTKSEAVSRANTCTLRTERPPKARNP